MCRKNDAFCERKKIMIFGKAEKRSKRPYFMIAVFTLAATSAVNLIQRGKKFIKEKAACIKDMMSGE